MKPYIKISLRTKIETSQWAIGEALIDILLENSVLTPDLVSHNPDKFSEIFPGKEGCKEIWASVAQLRVNGSMSEFHQDFCWKRKRTIRSRGAISHRMVNARSRIVPGRLSLHADWSDKVDWCTLFISLCNLLPPQLAMLHLFTEPELNSIGENHNFAIGSFGAALNPEIPGVGWAMFYGDEFSDGIDPKIIEAAGFKVEKIGSGYMVCATKEIRDVVADYAIFLDRREELKRILPAGLFNSIE
jgi:hypothetical protein